MISTNFLNDYVKIDDLDLKELAEKITKQGVNIEKIITKSINNIVIGQVVSCTSHPDSDHLHICKVDIGNDILDIVCGAPNVREGLKVLVALPGAILPGNFEIKKSTIRGQVSNGMLCALYELGLEEKTEENYSKGIYEVEENAPLGVDAIKYLGYDDTVYELDIHKHRNNDCYYHIGFAYEVASIINREVKLPKVVLKTNEEDINDLLTINVDTDKCPYYTSRIVKNIKIKESPDFIKKRLESVGMRSINNVVDISNYVMLEYGQPLHFFDREKLGNKIIVRNAKENEKITTLDGITRTLNTNDIVITDGTKIVALAGVMGGDNTKVDENTKDLVIESAIFDSVSIRTTSERLNLKSEASTRYGKGLNYEYTTMAIDRACDLLTKYADATVVNNTLIYDKIDKTKKEVEFKTEEINKLLGITLTDDIVKENLEKLNFTYEYKNNSFIVTIPNRRLDIDPNINDIAEEIGRLYGYHNLVSTLPKVPIKKGEYSKEVLLKRNVSKRLQSLGLNECKTYTLTSLEDSKLFNYDKMTNIILPNPMSNDKKVVRTSIIPSLINIYKYNNKRNIKDILIYEISKTYDINYNENMKVAILIKGNYIDTSWNTNKIECDLYVLKGIIENLLEYLGYKNRYHFIKDKIDDLHPGISAKILLDREEIGIIGKLHPSISKDDIYVCELSLTKLDKPIKNIKYKEVSIYPSINKDVAFIIDKNITSDTVLEEIKRVGGRLLTNIKVFDVYTGDKIDNDKKSIAYSLTFNSEEKTLTDEEVDTLFRNIIDKVNNKFNSTIRDK